jgi:hypothetical protein
MVLQLENEGRVSVSRVLLMLLSSIGRTRLFLSLVHMVLDVVWSKDA